MDYTNSSKFPDNSEVSRRAAGAGAEKHNGPRKIKRERDYRDDREERYFFADSFGNVIERAFWERAIPRVKELVSDVIDMWLGVRKPYGYDRRDYTRDYGRSRVTSIERDRMDRESYRPSRRLEDEWNDFVYESRDEALDYLYILERCISENGAVSIPRFYKEIGYKGGNYAVERYGWKNLDSVKIYYDDREEGFKMRFPTPVLLERRF